MSRETTLTAHFSQYAPTDAYYALEALPTDDQVGIREVLVDYRGRSDEDLANSLGVTVAMAASIRHVTRESV